MKAGIYQNKELCVAKVSFLNIMRLNGKNNLKSLITISAIKRS